MAAVQYAPQQLATAQKFGFNGATDANHGVTPFIHGTHDLGMGFDLELKQFINNTNQRDNSQPDADIALPGSGWSVSNAQQWTQNYLPSSLGPRNSAENDQRDALRQFLQLYALSADSGTRTALATHIVNAANKSLAINALFGNGTQSGGMVSQVHIGGSKGATNPTENTYANMRAILDALGVKPNSNVSPHNTHFHIFLAPPTAVNITASLQTDSVGDAPQTTDTADLLEAAQSLLTTVQASTQEEQLMFVMDVPYIPAQNPPLIVADAAASQQGLQTVDRVIGICHLSENPYDPTSAVNSMSPVLEVRNYFRNKERVTLNGPAKVRVLQNPAHGALEGNDMGAFAYFPEKGYLGNDRASLLVEIGGKTVRMEYFFRVMQQVPDQEGVDAYADNCPNKVSVWKISSATDANGNNFVTAVDIQAPTATAGVSAAEAAALVLSVGAAASNNASTVVPSFSVAIADLPDGDVGQTTGTTITLDATAAGHGWYVDPTPLDNSDDYLPTSNPDVWQAKAGTDAAGKMDLLSVLLHEYGHALGLEHSADSGDFMAATLQPGERRLPSAEELDLMAQLVGEIKSGSNGAPDTPQSPSLPIGTTLSALLVGRLRRSSYGSWSTVFDSVQIPAPTPQFEFAANPTLTNGNLNTANGWATQGDVAIGSGSAVLSESSTCQTRLNQVFMVGPQDSFLSFTLGGIALDDQASGPDDAFEVGLLDANTGASLAGAISRSRTDALLNLQANGAELAAQGVTHITNADGSRSYLVDLRGIAAGTAVNLSFDLIGFGANGSHVSVSDVRLSGMPQTRDDSVTSAEDTMAQIIAIANDIDVQQIGFAPVVVAAPAHGQVVVNADGSFSYTPAKDYNGSDSFTYKVSNGQVDSNVSTVDIIVTPVNDAPVAAMLNATTAEDTSLALDLLAQASDVDSTVLTSAIVAGPQHGTLTQDADGSFTYTPDANYNGADSFTYKVNDGELDSNLATVSLTVTAVNDAPVANADAVTTDEDTPLTISAASLLANDTDVDAGDTKTLYH